MHDSQTGGDLDPGDEHRRRAEQQREEGNACLRAGAGVGAVGLAGGLLVGSTCPLCIIATPALLAVGVYKRWQARRAPAPDDELAEDGASQPHPPRVAAR